LGTAHQHGDVVNGEIGKKHQEESEEKEKGPTETDNWDEKAHEFSSMCRGVRKQKSTGHQKIRYAFTEGEQDAAVQGFRGKMPPKRGVQSQKKNNLSPGQGGR